MCAVVAEFHDGEANHIRAVARYQCHDIRSTYEGLDAFWPIRPAEAGLDEVAGQVRELDRIAG